MRVRVFDFDHAITRTPGRSVVDGIRADPSATPDFDGVLREHAAYIAALQAAGLSVEVLPSLEAYPDSVFVEDPAFAIPEGAVVMRSGADARRGEAAEMRGTLARYFDAVFELSGSAYADGGDVLITPDVIFIGLSKRTNREGAETFCAYMERLGRGAKIVQTPEPILHFKTAVSLLSEDTLLATRQMADSGTFAGFQMMLVPDGEEGAANALRVNDTVLVGDSFPRTIDMLSSSGFNVKPLAVTEIGKLDAGLSCMSLRWMKRR